MNLVIGFSHPKKFSLHGELIEKIDNAPFDHTYIKFYSQELDRTIIYQSNWRGVGFIGEPLFLSTTQPIYEFQLEIDDQKFISLKQYYVDNVGIPYSLLGVLLLGIDEILSKFKININNLLRDKLSSAFCSEIVYRCLNEIDPEDFNLNPATISPKDLYNLLKKLNIKQIL